MALVIAAGLVFAGVTELGRLFGVSSPLRAILGDQDRAVRLAPSPPRRSTALAVAEGVVSASVGRLVSASRRRPARAGSQRRPLAVTGPAIGHPHVKPAPARPLIPAVPELPVPVAPAAELPGSPVTGTTGPSSPAASPRVHLALTHIDVVDAPAGDTGSQLLMRFALLDANEGSDTPTPASMPDHVDVRVAVPDVPVEVAASSALRLSVDVLASSDAAAGDAQLPDASLRVRVAFTDATVSAPVASEAPAAADGASNTIEVLAPLVASDPAPPDQTDGSDPAALQPLTTDATQVLIPVATDDGTVTTGTQTVDVPPAPAADGQDPQAAPPVTLTFDVAATVTADAPPADGGSDPLSGGD